MIVFPLIRFVGLKAATASSKGETVADGCPMNFPTRRSTRVAARLTGLSPFDHLREHTFELVRIDWFRKVVIDSRVGGQHTILFLPPTRNRH